MEIKELKPLTPDHKEIVLRSYERFKHLLIELRKKEIPVALVNAINVEIDHVNSVSVADFKKSLRKAQANILKMVEKELKLVPKNYYRNTWLAVGMAAFGIPFGTALGMSTDNMALLGVGLPLGMAIGMAIGNQMDQKAIKEGRQLNIEIT
ncbi:MAG: hypothetical protein N4A71_22575 [Carboxylicivirga sp.]|jgi:hypothetical protein|nr:hypothetical protein [Carboxylicivirga sp.]MCT4643366.1 hypothetical protein [Carboxylicivirga sp.]